MVNGEAVVNGVVLKERDSVEVQSGASASIVFFDNSISRLSSGTKVIITEITGGDEIFFYGEQESIGILG